MGMLSDRDSVRNGGVVLMLRRWATHGVLVLPLVIAASISISSNSGAEEKAAKSKGSKAPEAGVDQARSTEQPAETEKETVEIPLNEIWAWDMPECKNIMELISEGPTTKQANWLKIEDISRSLAPLKSEEEREAAFVVEGMGLDALERAYTIRTGKDKAKDFVSAGSDVSIVFFAHALNPHIHISKVSRHQSRIEIEYEVIPTIDAGRTAHFAFIPIRNIEAGEYEITFSRAKEDGPSAEELSDTLSPQAVDQAICKPFRFTAAHTKEE